MNENPHYTAWIGLERESIIGSAGYFYELSLTNTWKKNH